MTDVDVRAHEMLEESGLPTTEHDLVDFLVALEKHYVETSVPRPGPELAALLSGGLAEPLAVRPHPGRRRRVVAAGATALSAVLATGIAAAANELPAPAQRWAVEFADRYLPFDLPEPQRSSVDSGTRQPDSETHPGGRDEDSQSRSRVDDSRSVQPPGPTGQESSSAGVVGVSERARSTGADARDEATVPRSDERAESDSETREGTGHEDDADADTRRSGAGDPERAGEEEAREPDRSEDSEHREEVGSSGDGSGAGAAETEESDDTEESRDR